MGAYEITDHHYDVIVVGAGGQDCELRWAWRHLGYVLLV